MRRLGKSKNVGRGGAPYFVHAKTDASEDLDNGIVWTSSCPHARDKWGMEIAIY